MMIKNIKEYVKKNEKRIKLYVILSLTCFLFLFIYRNIAFKIFLVPIGIIFGYYTTMFGKFIPHIAPETMTIMAVFSGASFGWKYGLFFGIFVPLVVYSTLGLIKLTTLINCLVIATGGVFAGALIMLGLNSTSVFLISLILRSIIGVLAFWNITSDKLEALSHAILDPMFNIAIYMPIFLTIYNLI